MLLIYGSIHFILIYLGSPTPHYSIFKKSVYTQSMLLIVKNIDIHIAKIYMSSYISGTEGHMFYFQDKLIDGVMLLEIDDFVLLILLVINTEHRVVENISYFMFPGSIRRL